VSRDMNLLIPPTNLWLHTILDLLNDPCMEEKVYTRKHRRRNKYLLHCDYRGFLFSYF